MHFSVLSQGKALITPSKKPLSVPTQPLADAISAEWQTHAKYSPSKMPLTALAYAAMDTIRGEEKGTIEALLVYIDTDTLSYRASDKKLADQQARQWQPVLDWLAKTFGVTWEVTTGVMPIEQPEALHKAIRTYLETLDAFQLSAVCMLASGLSSLALTIAVLKKHLDAASAFTLSRLEEEAQAEQWGRDAEAEQRAARLKEDVLHAERFLRLLDVA